MLADMAIGIEAGRMLTYKAATEIDAGRNNTMFASMAKVCTLMRSSQLLSGDCVHQNALLCLRRHSQLIIATRWSQTLFKFSAGPVSTLSTQSRSCSAMPKFTRYGPTGLSCH